MSTISNYRSDFKRFLLIDTVKMSTQEEEDKEESNVKSKADESPLKSKPLDDGDQVVSQKVKNKLVTKQQQQSDTSSSSVKDDAKYFKYLKKGDQACKENRFEDASYLYTLALLYAPDPALKDSCLEENADSTVSALVLAHEKRSAVFFHLHQWSNCLVDIDCAIKAGGDKYTNIQPLAYRTLLIRKVECLIAIGQYSKARRIWATEPMLTSANNPAGPEEDIAQMERLKHLHFYIDENYAEEEEVDFNPLLNTVTGLMNSKQYKPSEGTISLSAKVTPMFGGGKKGSNCSFFVEVVATSHLAKDEIVAVEEPYLIALYEQYELLLCHFCCASLESTHPKSGRLQVAGPVVPCTGCTRVLYCSPTCRDISWSAFHRFECAILPKLYHSGGHLAFRILLSTGLKTIAQAIKEEAVSNSEFPIDATDLVSLYGQLYNSVPFEMAVSADVSSTVDEMMDLAEQCGFFTTTTTIKEIDLARQVLLRHILQLKGSRARRPVSVFEASPPFPSAVYREVPIAEALYPISALFERAVNDGDSNLQVNFVNGHQMIVSAAQKIVPGEKLLLPTGIQQRTFLNEQQ